VPCASFAVQGHGEGGRFASTKGNLGMLLADVSSTGLVKSMCFDPDGPGGPAPFGPNAIYQTAIGLRFERDGKRMWVSDSADQSTAPLAGSNCHWEVTTVEVNGERWTHTNHYCTINFASGGQTECLQLLPNVTNSSFSPMRNARLSFSLGFSPNGTKENRLDLIEDVIEGLPLIRAGLPGQQYFGLGAYSPVVVADSVSPVSADPNTFSNQDANDTISPNSAASFVFDLGTLQPWETKIVELLIFAGLSDEDLKKAFIRQLEQERVSPVELVARLEPIELGNGEGLFRVMARGLSRDGVPEPDPSTRVFLDINGVEVRNGEVVRLVVSATEKTVVEKQGNQRVFRAPMFVLTAYAHNGNGGYALVQDRPSL
jgi:hypothetical protein